MQHKLAIICVALASIMSCKIVKPSATKFIAYEQHMFRLYILAWKLHRKHWDISYRYGNECPAAQTRNAQALEQAISKALQIWLAPLRDLTKRPIVNDFRYQLNADLAEVDMRITFQCKLLPSFVLLNNRENPDIVLRVGTEVPRLMNSLVHEIGHAFGLTDTYSGAEIIGDPLLSTGGLKKTAGTQPPSIMSSHLNIVGGMTKLGEDDKRGIIWLYKYFFDGLADDCFLPDGSRSFLPQQCNYNFLAIDDCFFPDYVFEEEPRGCVPKYPLIFEVKHGKYVLRLLKEDPQIDVNAQDDADMTALHYAVMYEKEEVVKTLLAHQDIKPSLKDKQGRTPLDIALAAEHTAIIKMFPAIEPPHRKEDVNGDGVVNILDLLAVTAKFGQKDAGNADINGDGTVDIRDLVLVAGEFGVAAAAPAVQAEARLTTATVAGWLSAAQKLTLQADYARGLRKLQNLHTMLAPRQTALLANYPNPFNPETWFPYQLAQPAPVSISIYNPQGELVRTLVLGHQPAGMYQDRSRAAHWDGRNARGELVASGVYFYTLSAGNFTATRKMLLRK